MFKLKIMKSKKVNKFNGIKLLLLGLFVTTMAAGCAEDEIQPKNKALEKERNQQLLDLVVSDEN